MRNDEVLHLASLGYHLVPWANRNNAAPRPLVKGWLTSRFSLDTIKQFTSTYPEADWAVVPLEAVVLDLECKNGLDGIADLGRMCADHGCSYDSLIAECAVTRTKSNGRHIWFRAPEHCALKGGQHIASGVEVKRINGSCHVPPSMGYEWIRPLGSVTTLPILPEWLVTAWSEARIESNPASPKLRIFANGERNLAMCAFAAEARRTLALDKEELREFLAVVRRTRCENPETFSEEETNKIADHYAERSIEGVGILALNGDETAKSVLRFVTKTDQPLAAQPKLVTQREVALVAPVLAPEDLYPTPLIKEVVSWMLESSISPQPEQCLLSTLVAMGVAIGRRWSFIGCTPNIYGMALAPTTGGKEHPKRMLSQIMGDSGFSNIILGNVASDAGFATHMQTLPEMLWIEDEFAGRMEAFSRTDRPMYIVNLISALLEGYTGANIYPKVTKDGASSIIMSPFMSVYGVAQDEDFWKYCTKELITRGFIGRLSVVMGRPRQLGETLKTTQLAAMTKIRENTINKTQSEYKTPDEFVKVLQSARAAESALKRKVGSRDSEEVKASKKIVEYMSEQSAAMIQHMYDNHAPGSIEIAVSGRDSEKVERFALLHAWSLNPAAPVITADGIDWARRFVDYCTAVSIYGYKAKYASVLGDDADMDYVASLIDAFGPNGISQADLYTKTRKIHMKIEKLLDALVKSDRIRRTIQPTQRRPKTVWISTKYDPKESPT